MHIILKLGKGFITITVFEIVSMDAIGQPCCNVAIDWLHHYALLREQIA